MGIALAVSGRPRLVVDAETITIGSDPACNVVLTEDDRIKPRHAVIRRVAGRWMVEVREAETIQVGDRDPARLHWLAEGDVIHLVDNGPVITFQPPEEKGAVPPLPSAPVEVSIPLAPPTEPPLRPAETIAPAPRYDSLFAPLTEPSAPSFAAPREAPSPEPTVARTPPAPPVPRKPARKKSPSSPSLPMKNRFADAGADEPYKVAEEPKHTPTPVLRRGLAGVSDDGQSSQTALGWTIIWVAVGLGVVLIIVVILFGGGAAT